jgi:hypothetical protein
MVVNMQYNTTGNQKMRNLFLMLMASGLLSSYGQAMQKQEHPQLIDKCPVEMWQHIAECLPGNEEWLKDMARLIPLADEVYDRMARALMDAVVEQPLPEEVPAWIKRRFATTKFNVPLKAKMGRALTFAHPPQELRAFGDMLIGEMFPGVPGLELALPMTSQEAQERLDQLKDIYKQSRTFKKLAQKELSSANYRVREFLFPVRLEQSTQIHRLIFLTYFFYHVLDYGPLALLFGNQLTLTNPRIYLQILMMPPVLIEHLANAYSGLQSSFCWTNFGMLAAFAVGWAYYNYTNAPLHGLRVPFSLQGKYEIIDSLMKACYAKRDKLEALAMAD